MRVLLIEDDTIHAHLLTLVLRGLYGVGMTIEIAPTFALAEERAQDGTRWDLVVADLRLPNGSSDRILRGLPAVLTTAADPGEARTIATRLQIPYADKGDIEGIKAACLKVCPIAPSPPASSWKTGWSVLSTRARLVAAMVPLVLGLIGTIFGMGITRGQAAAVDERHDRDIDEVKGRVDRLDRDLRVRLEGIDRSLGERLGRLESTMAGLDGKLGGILFRLGGSSLPGGDP